MSCLQNSFLVLIQQFQFYTLFSEDLQYWLSWCSSRWWDSWQCSASGPWDSGVLVDLHVNGSLLSGLHGMSLVPTFYFPLVQLFIFLLVPTPTDNKLYSILFHLLINTWMHRPRRGDISFFRLSLIIPYIFSRKAVSCCLKSSAGYLASTWRPPSKARLIVCGVPRTFSYRNLWSLLACLNNI